MHLGCCQGLAETEVILELEEWASKLHVYVTRDREPAKKTGACCRFAPLHHGPYLVVELV